MKIEDIPLSLHFHQVAILQNKNRCRSRLDANVSSEIVKGVVRPIPLIASNMVHVVNAEFINELWSLGAFGIMHRGTSEEAILKEMKKVVKKCEWSAASIGVNDGQYEFARKLVDIGVNIINVDVAHGYADYVIELGRKIKKELGVKVIIGNANSIDMYEEVVDFADALRVGIGGGFSCVTKNTAACTEGQFTTIYKYRELVSKYGMPVISDGGLREPADFVKAILAGSSACMAGSILARCPSSAAPTMEVDGKLKKAYAGMASRYIQDLWKGKVKKGTCAEGKVNYVDIGEPVEDLLERYSGALRSGITYAGGVDIKSAQEVVKFTRV